MGLFDHDPVISLMARTMDLRLRKHATIASNIAHVDTPGYRAKQFAFESELAKLVDQGKHRDPMAVASLSGQVLDVPDRVGSSDGNTVDLDKQMAMMSGNTLEYSTIAQMTQARLSNLKFVIENG